VNPDDLPTRPGVYQDQAGRGFALFKERWYFLTMGREVRWRDMQGVDYLVPLGPMNGNIEPDFKPFRARKPISEVEEA
jgi:hypothetical protein